MKGGLGSSWRRRVLHGALGVAAALVVAAAPAASVPIADSVVEHKVRSVIKGDARFLDTSLEVSVVAGFVWVRGSFHDPADVAALERRITGLPGVVEVEIDPQLVATRPEAGIRRSI